jgi:hypothetical protein
MVPAIARRARRSGDLATTEFENAYRAFLGIIVISKLHGFRFAALSIDDDRCGAPTI